jgi:Rrf2 family protein
MIGDDNPHTSAWGTGLILSQTAVYALKATLCLAESGLDGPVRVDDIAQRLGVPRNYLSKILHALARADVLDSTRGPRGGFRLARAAEDVTLSQVIEHFDDVAGQSGCLLGRERCSDADPCPAHERWRDVSRAVIAFFDGTSIADLSKNGSLLSTQHLGQS